jgi:hypothetical protein
MKTQKRMGCISLSIWASHFRGIPDHEVDWKPLKILFLNNSSCYSRKQTHTRLTWRSLRGKLPSSSHWEDLWEPRGDRPVSTWEGNRGGYSPSLHSLRLPCVSHTQFHSENKSSIKQYELYLTRSTQERLLFWAKCQITHC